jgi:hypothetical protein
MAGALTISTLNNDTGVLATQNGMTGIAKAWVIFNATNGAIRGTSFNISSVTRSASAQYDIVFSTSMASANYVVTVSTSTAIGLSVAGATNLFYNKVSNIEVAPTTSGFTMNTQSSNGTSNEPQYVCVAVFGA